ncbi:5'-3' exoribonuclease 2 [Dispira simplex]|nr:5'-3' exoribonuclease 2 [Dispira simplex]
MGVPAFFRWLAQKYPKIVQPVCEANGEVTSADLLGANPNGTEFDNLYLDMNGIIHPCANPQRYGMARPTSEEEIMASIFAYIDHLFTMIRPRKLVYMAIDGVAPRAKMNQQRARRFQAARASKLEAASSKVNKEEITIEDDQKSFKFDTNTITPGTPFMARLATCLRYYVVQKMNTEPAWKKIKVIISDAGVPGEGEHKIMDFIRRQRAEPTYNPNTKHVLYGLDADLIMLALASHEPHFKILREDVLRMEILDRRLENANRHNRLQGKPLNLTKSRRIPFIFLHINVLREYLCVELSVPGRPFNLERAIDDWVCLCFFVGNDFLPHLPALEIKERALDKLVEYAKAHFQKTGKYLTNCGTLNMSAVQDILSQVAEAEAVILQNRLAREQATRNSILNQENLVAANLVNVVDSPDDHAESDKPEEIYSEMPIDQGEESSLSDQQDTKSEAEGSPDDAVVVLNNGQGNPSMDTSETIISPCLVPSPPPVEMEIAEELEMLCPHEGGYEGSYYQLKFHVAPGDVEFRRQVCRAYLEGLSWVLRYYYHGCPSWSWYYPYHYAPLAADFKDTDQSPLDFPPSQPIRPLEQLMSVLPAASRACLPSAYANLMVAPQSEIIEFYPETFELDFNGKKYDWQAVVLLPFIDAQKLHGALEKVNDTLNAEELRRNTLGNNILLVGPDDPLHGNLGQTYAAHKDSITNEPVKLSPTAFSRMSGLVRCIPNFVPCTTYPSPFQSPDLTAIDNNACLMVMFDLPCYRPSRWHTIDLLPGLCVPKPKLTSRDIKSIRQEKTNMLPRKRGLAPCGNGGHAKVQKTLFGRLVVASATQPPSTETQNITPPAAADSSKEHK